MTINFNSSHRLVCLFFFWPAGFFLPFIDFFKKKNDENDWFLKRQHKKIECDLSARNNLYPDWWWPCQHGPADQCHYCRPSYAELWSHHAQRQQQSYDDMVSQGKAGNSTLKKEKKNTLCVVLLSCWPVFIFVFSRYIWVSFRFRFFFQFSVDVSAGHRRTNGARNVSTSKLSRQFLLSCPHVQHDPLFLFFFFFLFHRTYEIGMIC